MKAGEKLLVAMQTDKTGVDLYQIELVGSVRVYETLYSSLQPSDDIDDNQHTAFRGVWSPGNWSFPENVSRLGDSLVLPCKANCNGETEPPATKAHWKEGRRKTPPLKPEQTEALNRNFDALLTPSFGKKDVVNAMGVDPSTLCRLLQGNSSDKTRKKLAAVLATRHRANFAFEDLLDPAFDLNKLRSRPDTPDQA